MAIYPNRVCKMCGATFAGGPRAFYCETCRLIRQKESKEKYKDNLKSGNVRKIGSKDKCRICGKEIIVKSVRHIYCKECAKKHLQEFDNKKSINYYYNILDKEHRKEVRKKRYNIIKISLNAKRRTKYKAKRS